MGPKGVVGLAGALIVVLLVLSSVYIIPETHRGVLLRFGELVETDIQAGIHFKVPVIDQVREFDIRVLTMDLPSRQYLTVEKKPLDVDSYIAWKIRDVDQFYRATGGDEFRAQSLLASRVDNGLRDEFGIRTMVEVVSGQRDDLHAYPPGQGKPDSPERIWYRGIGYPGQGHRIPGSGQRKRLPPDGDRARETGSGISFPWS